jgi:Torus domain
MRCTIFPGMPWYNPNGWSNGLPSIPNNSRKPLLEETASVAISLLAIVVVQIVISGGRLLIALFLWFFVLMITCVQLGSYDIDRALCHFWLCGQCAKGEQCEFLHHLPQNIDVQGHTAAMHCMDIVDDQEPSDNPQNDFPMLSQAEM